MIKKNLSIILITVSLSLTSLCFISCGDEHNGRIDHPRTPCLTNSTHFCEPVERNYFQISSIIKEECQNELTLGVKPSVFGKTYVNVNFPRPFNECIEDENSLKKVSASTESSILFYYDELSEVVTVEEFLNSEIEGFISNLEIRPYTNLSEFIKQECRSERTIRDKVTVDGKEWLNVTFSKQFKDCYNSLPNESIPGFITNYTGNRIRIRVDNEAPTVSSIDELLHLSFTTSVEYTDLSD